MWSPHSYHHHHPTILLVLASGKHHYGLNEHLPTPPLEQLHDWFTKDKGHIQYINSITNKELLSSSHQSIMPEPETGIRHARKVSSLSSKELLIWCFVWHKITISYPQARTFLLRRYNARGNRDKATIQKILLLFCFCGLETLWVGLSKNEYISLSFIPIFPPLLLQLSKSFTCWRSVDQYRASAPSPSPRSLFSTPWARS